jgi:peptidoglycan/xylan/chitin deacetylase (PgdA/CDA1 family)
MLNYRNTTICFSVIAALLLVIHVRFAHLSWLVPAVFLFDYSLLLFYGSYFIESRFYMPVVCKIATQEKIVSLTFDDGPHPEITPAVLDLLKEYGLKATFFCIGKNILGNEAILRRIEEEGHIVANHSYAHDFWFDLNATGTFERDLSEAADLINACTGKYPRYFRPPYGVTTPNLSKAVGRLNYVSIGWNIRTYDTVSSDPGKVIPKIAKKLRPGSIILFHDRMPETVHLLRASMDYIMKEGYRIVPMNELIKAEPYA